MKDGNFEEIKTVDENIKPIDWFDEHYYLISQNGEDLYYPSVTTILQVSPKPFLNKWRGDLGNEEADRVKAEAASRGSNIHHACQIISEGGIVKLHQGKSQLTIAELEELKSHYKGKIKILYDQSEYLQAYRFMRFLEEVKPTNIIAEQTVFSHVNRFAGTLDYKFYITAGKYAINGSKSIELNEGWYIADIKSSNYLYPENFMQLSAYWEADEEQYHDGIVGALLIHTNGSTRTGIEGLSVKVISPEENVDYFNNFLKIYDVWKINPSPANPKVFQLPHQLTFNPLTQE